MTYNKYIDALSNSSEYHEHELISNLGPLLISNKSIHIFCIRSDYTYKDYLIEDIYNYFDDLKNIKFKIVPCLNDTIKIIFYNLANMNQLMAMQENIDYLKAEGHNYFYNGEYFINYLSDQLMHNQMPKEMGIFLGYSVQETKDHIGHYNIDCNMDLNLDNDGLAEYSEARKIINEELEYYADIRELIKSIDEGIF